MRLPLFLLAGAPLLAALAAACGGNVVTNGAGAGAATTTSQASTPATSSGAGGGGLSSAGCPSSAPVEGDACAPEDAVCSYGDTTLAECRKVWVCLHGAWGPGAITCPGPSLGCPSTEPPALGSCDPDAGSDPCGYPDGTVCTCGPCPPFGGVCMPGPPEWFCDSTNNGAGCPPLIPNQGSTCSDPGLTCHYPSAGCGYATACTGGNWAWEPQPCPG